MYAVEFALPSNSRATYNTWANVVTIYVAPAYVDSTYIPTASLTRLARLKPWRRDVVHAPPPVALELCTAPMPEPRRIEPQPRGVAWLAHVHGGQRDRRPLRARVERKDAT